MHSLDTIINACNQAITDEEEGREWQYDYANKVDPRSVLELIVTASRAGDMPSAEEMAALGKTIRDLSGYLRFMAGGRPNPVRDDLVQQANQLLGLTGL